MTFARKKLFPILVTVAVTAATAFGDNAAPYEEVISANGACREYFWEGIDAIGAGKLKDARDKLNNALKQDAGCFLAYLLLSQVEYADGNDKKSTEYLQRIPPEPPELTGLYEELAAALRADDYETVAAQAEKFIAAYPQTIRAVAALHLLGRAQYHLGRRAEAALTLKAAYMYSDLAPGTVPAYGSQAEAEELEKFAGLR